MFWNKRQGTGFGGRRNRFYQNLFELLKTRFEDAVTFDFNISEEDKKGFVVPLSGQLCSKILLNIILPLHLNH